MYCENCNIYVITNWWLQIFQQFKTLGVSQFNEVLLLFALRSNMRSYEELLQYPSLFTVDGEWVSVTQAQKVSLNLSGLSCVARPWSSIFKTPRRPFFLLQKELEFNQSYRPYRYSFWAKSGTTKLDIGPSRGYLATQQRMSRFFIHLIRIMWQK